MGLLSVPLKTVLLYYATTQNEAIPESYVVCDGTVLTAAQQDINPGGTFATPDLRNRFVLGADITKAPGVAGGTTNAATDAPGPQGAGGVHSKTLITAELPAHSHTGTVASSGAHTHAGSTAVSNGDHTHTASMSTAGAHTHAGTSTSTTGAHTHASSSVGAGGGHTHTVSDPGHQHFANRANANTAGSGGAVQSAVVATDIATSAATTGITLNSVLDHTHPLTIISDGSHTHTVTVVSDGDHTHLITVATTGAHTHTLSIVSDGAHTHTFTGDPTGSGTAFDTRPRYYGLVYIMKVKI